MREFIWVFTLLGNIYLALILFCKEHYIRYSWLFASAMLSIGAEVMMWFSQTHDYRHYAELCRIIYWLCLGVNGMIVIESWKLGNKWVRRPVEIQLAMELIGFLAEKVDPLWGWRIQYLLRITNLLMIVFFCWIFRAEARYELRTQRP